MMGEGTRDEAHWDELVAMLVGPKLVGDNGQQRRNAECLAAAARRFLGRSDLAGQVSRG